MLKTYGAVDVAQQWEVLAAPARGLEFWVCRTLCILGGPGEWPMRDWEGRGPGLKKTG